MSLMGDVLPTGRVPVCLDPVDLAGRQAPQRCQVLNLGHRTITHSGGIRAFCGGNLSPLLIQMNADDCPLVSVVIAIRPVP